MTKRGGSGWPRTQPTFPRLSSWIKFVGRLVGLPGKEPEELDWEEAAVYVRVREEVLLGLSGTACGSRWMLWVNEVRVGSRDRLNREKLGREGTTGGKGETMGGDCGGVSEPKSSFGICCPRDTRVDDQS